MSSIRDYFRSGVDGALHYAPLISAAAVDEDLFGVNINLVIARAISVVAIPLIALSGLGWVFPAISRKMNPRIVYLSLHSLSSLVFVFERWKGGVAADQLAAKKYESRETHSAEVSRHLCSTDRAFRYLGKNVDLSKPDTEGKTLLDRMFYPAKWYSTVRKTVVDMGQDLLIPGANGKKFLMRAVESRDEALLEHLFGPKGKIPVASLTGEQQGDIWTQVKSVHILELLYSYGFDINARNSSGLTPLMHWAKSHEVPNYFRDDSRSKLVCAALNAGADPLLKHEDRKASDLAIKDSLEQKFLLQGEREFNRPKVPLIQEEGFFAKLPWKSSVINEKNWRDPYTAKKHFLTGLWLPIAINGLPLLSERNKWLPLSESTMKVVRCANTAFCLIALVLGPIELWRSGHEASRYAVNDYLAKIIPSKKTADMIRRNVEAAHLLLRYAPKEAAYLQRVDKEGGSLFFSANEEVLKLLIEAKNGAIS